MTDTPSPDLFPTLLTMLTFYGGLLCVPSTVSRAVKDKTTEHPCLERPPLHTRSTANVFNYSTDHSGLSLHSLLIRKQDWE